jgi:hypothetical protein
MMLRVEPARLERLLRTRAGGEQGGGG